MKPERAPGGETSPPLVPVAAALAVMVASQVVRLQQSEPELWLAADYGGRLVALAILWLAPGARASAFKREQFAIGAGQAGLWLIGLALLDVFVLTRLRFSVDVMFSGLRFGVYAQPLGYLALFDTTFGLALVALHEEIVFRRVTRAVLRPRLGDGWLMVSASALLFGLYHWQFGVGTVVGAFVFGVFAMLFYKRAGTIAPIVIAHYLANAIPAFSRMLG